MAAQPRRVKAPLLASRAGWASNQRGLLRALAVVAALSGASGCVPLAAAGKGPYTIVAEESHGPVLMPEIGQEEWSLSRERLTRMRSVLPRGPYVQRVRVSVADPRTGKLYEARGAVAVSPERAARLVLLGPGGATALDIWVTQERFRFSIPALEVEKRGRHAREAPGLPIGFLRWWFLSPLGGTLALARSGPDGSSFLLRDGQATVMLRTDGQRFVAIRREGGHLEALEWTGKGLAPHAGARGRYVEGDWGLRVHVFVEEVLEDEPDPAAFVDPDEGGTAL